MKIEVYKSCFNCENLCMETNDYDSEFFICYNTCCSNLKSFPFERTKCSSHSPSDFHSTHNGKLYLDEEAQQNAEDEL